VYCVRAAPLLEFDYVIVSVGVALRPLPTMAHRVLIVDDQASLLERLRALLSSAEWSVCGAAMDGLEAVEKAKSLRPDVIIMDISMPRMDGVEATRLIRKEVPEAKVLVLSQNDPEILARQAAAANAHGFISKSDISEHLLALMKRIVAA
jgi:DNA-binding NarL/FixJ family response regulator